jgi:hypothetical protein
VYDITNRQVIKYYKKKKKGIPPLFSDLWPAMQKEEYEVAKENDAFLSMFGCCRCWCILWCGECTRVYAHLCVHLRAHACVCARAHVCAHVVCVLHACGVLCGCLACGVVCGCLACCVCN